MPNDSDTKIAIFYDCGDKSVIRPFRANEASDYIRHRAKTMKVERLGDKIYRVTPAEEGKKPRLVRFHIDFAVECFDPMTKEGCEANAHDRICAHALSAIDALIDELLTFRQENQ